MSLAKMINNRADITRATSLFPSSVLSPDVSIEVALLRELRVANGADKSRLDAALVVPVPPEGREDRVLAVAIGTSVFLPPPSVAVRLRVGLLRRGLFAALERPVTRQGRHQREISVAVYANVLPGRPSASHAHLVPQGHRAKVPGVSGDPRSRRQRGHRPVRRAVLTCNQENERDTDSIRSLTVIFGATIHVVGVTCEREANRKLRSA